MSETKQFLSDLETDQNKDVDVFDQSFTPPSEQEGEKKLDDNSQSNDDLGELKEISPKNRRERRLMTKLEQERESNIFLAGKLQAREEARRTVSEESDYLKAVERIYGTETPEAQLATDLFKKAITGAMNDAEERVYNRIKSERQQEIEDERKGNERLDSVIDDIENTYNVELTDVQEKAYLQLLKRMSPKDSDGNVVDLADPHAVWEEFQQKLHSKKNDTTAKELSNRSLVQSGAATDSKVQDDTQQRYLRSIGVL